MRMKKKIFIPVVFCLFSMVNAQLVIGKETVSQEQISLEFGDSEPRGLILPYVSNLSEITDEGALVFDATDFKVKLKNGVNNWFDLTIDNTGTADLTSQNTDLEDQPNSQIIIGNQAELETAHGILVLADDDAAMVLPKVESPHLTIKNPSAGMMVYDTISKQLAVFNGTVWSFWKP